MLKCVYVWNENYFFVFVGIILIKWCVFGGFCFLFIFEWIV